MLHEVALQLADALLISFFGFMFLPIAVSSSSLAFSSCSIYSVTSSVILLFYGMLLKTFIFLISDTIVLNFCVGVYVCACAHMP